SRHPERLEASDLLWRQRHKTRRAAHDRALDETDVDRLLQPAEPKPRRIEHAALAVKERSAFGYSQSRSGLRRIDEGHLRMDDVDIRQHRSHHGQQIRGVQISDRLAQILEPGKVTLERLFTTKVSNVHPVDGYRAVGGNVEIFVDISVGSDHRHLMSTS